MDIKPIDEYINPSHLGDSIFFDKIVNDAKFYTASELKSLVGERECNFRKRLTALYMLASLWNEDGISEIYNAIKADDQYLKYLEELLGEYNFDLAKDLVNKLFNENKISKEKKEILDYLINQNIKCNRNPIEKWGRTVFKS